jgi:hypothetical protein
MRRNPICTVRKKQASVARFIETFFATCSLFMQARIIVQSRDLDGDECAHRAGFLPD